MNRSQRQRLLGPLLQRIQMVVSRAVVTLVDDAKGVQAMQLSGLADEVIEDAERLQDYGFTSVPFPEAEAVVVFPGGLRSHALVVAVGDRRYRLKGLAEGEVAIFDDQGQSVILKRAGIRLETPFAIEAVAGEAFRITAPTIELIGDVVVGGVAGQGKPIARHDDAVVAGKVVATATKSRAL
jgi:phage baseplate assembly protein V